MQRQILGYDSCPCSIFLNLKSQIGTSAYHDLKVEDDWTLKCPEICLCWENIPWEMGLKMPPKVNTIFQHVKQMLFRKGPGALIVTWPEKATLFLCNVMMHVMYDAVSFSK